MQHLDLYVDYPAWLSAVARIVKDMRQQGFHKRQQLATTAIRLTHGAVFGGVGVYTVAELFFMAGELV